MKKLKNYKVEILSREEMFDIEGGKFLGKVWNALKQIWEGIEEAFQNEK